MKISNNQRKLISSLDKARHRDELRLFKAEGTKCVLDTLGAFRVKYLAATKEWLDIHKDVINHVVDESVLEATRADMERMSHLTTAPDVTAVYEIPKKRLDINSLKGQLVIALDDVQDPGNLGTIVRMADWFGVTTILCSQSTVDIYNSKSVMATMGAISRVDVHYCNLAETLAQLSGMMPVYGTFLEGENVFATPLTRDGIIVMGNEGSGISATIGRLVTRKITIPSFARTCVAGTGAMESLNVAMAAAIITAQFKGREYGKS